MLTYHDERNVRRRRWRQALLAIGLSLAGCCGVPSLLLVAGVNGWPLETPSHALRTSAGLVLPASADVQYFREFSALDTCLQIRFVAPASDVRAFLAQKPLRQAEWMRNEDLIHSPFDGREPKAPFRSAGIDRLNAGYLRMTVEERGEEPWTVWVQWFTT